MTDGKLEVTLPGHRRGMGRGAYLCQATSCRELVLTKGKLARALKLSGQTIGPDDIREALIRALQKEENFGFEN